jgi:hypothetical protein
LIGAGWPYRARMSYLWDVVASKLPEMFPLLEAVLASTQS